MTKEYGLRALVYAALTLLIAFGHSAVLAAQSDALRGDAHYSATASQLDFLQTTLTRYREERAQVGAASDATLQGELLTVKRYLENGRYVDAADLLTALDGDIRQAVVVAASAPPPAPATTPAPSPAPTPAPTPVPPVATPHPKPPTPRPPTPRPPTPTPPPPPAGGGVSSRTLTIEGILYWTNVQRRNNGVGELRINSQLNVAAANRVADMFAQNYFAHTSPDGRSYTDFVNAAGYHWQRIAENIAYGTAGYYNDQQVVDMWMNSPGHRANLLNPVYTEIGIGVGDGTYQGNPTWFADQLFGTP